MPCKTILDVIPTSYLGAGKVQELLDKIPQAKLPSKKKWEESKAWKAFLWVTNPANQALIRQLMDFKNLGNLQRLVLLANLTQALGMEGLLDLDGVSSKITDATTKVTDVLGCVTKNIQAVQESFSLVQETLTALVAPSNIFKALGLSDIMAQSGLVSSYAFPEIQKSLNNIPGIQQLTQLPGVFNTIPTPYIATQALQSVYTVNALAQTLQMLDSSRHSQEAFDSASSVAALGSYNGMDGQFTQIDPSEAPALAQSIAAGESFSTMTAAVQQNASALAAVQEGLGRQSPPSPTPSPETMTLNGAPVSQETVDGIAAAGADAQGLMQGASEYASVMVAIEDERLEWRRRCLVILKHRMMQEYTDLISRVRTANSMQKFLPTENVNQEDMAPVLAAFQMPNDPLLERARVLSYKIKEVMLELAVIDQNLDLTKNAQSLLGDFSEQLQKFDPNSSVANAVLQSSRATASKFVVPAKCGFQPIPSSISVGGVTVAIRFSSPNSSNQVHPDVINLLTKVVAGMVSVVGSTLKSITITSGTRNYVPSNGSQTSYHLYGRAIDIGVFNAESVSRSSHLTEVCQQAAIRAGAVENFGPFYKPEKGGRPHVHLSPGGAKTCDARGFPVAAPPAKTAAGE